MLRYLGIVLIFAAIGSGVGEYFSLRLPTLSWGFELSRNVDVLRSDSILWFGWLVAGGVFCFGLYLLVKFFRPGAINPVAARKVERFKKIKRGYYSLLILLGLAGLASLDQCLVGKEALVVRSEGRLSFPAFTRALEKGSDYGLEGEDAVTEPNYRALKRQFANDDREGDWVILPLWPYSPTNDTISALARKIVPGDSEYSGLGSRLYDVGVPEKQHLRFKYRKGVRQGDAQGWDGNGTPVYRAKYRDDQLIAGSEVWSGEGSVTEFLAASGQEIYDVSFPPSEPTLADAPRHFLGTTSEGYDVIAYLFGGLKVNFQAAIIYIPIVYFIGITVGLLMGYFGGVFDLVVQRIIEVISNIPFLFLVIIVASVVPAQWKDRFGLYLILAVLAAFGWMGMTYLMRTSALKEKARDYIAASRVIGASTPRILFRHLLPNSVAIVVTLIPFSVSGLILSLTALDYLGFGLPPKYATWGKLLKDGLDNLSSPWLVSSAFLCLVILLVLVTFVGEAVREAFDPKKYTVYR